MSKDCNQIDLKLQRKARTLALQRARRHGVKRIDYQPNARAFAIIAAQLKPYVGSDSSSVIDRLILKAAGVAPELMHSTRRRAPANDLAESPSVAGNSPPLRAPANDFDNLPTLAVGERARYATRDTAKRVICGARRRSDGLACNALSVHGKMRCKWHGGCSTGPRTAEGKSRVIANLPKRR